MKIIVNASPLIFLSKLGKLDLLNEVFEEVYTTNEVLEEILEGLAYGKQDALLVKRKVEKNEISLLKNNKKLNLDHLGAGERSIIEAAQTHDIKTLVLDDLTAIKTAKYFGLDVFSTPFIMLKSLKLKKIEKKEFVSMFERLIIDFDYRISPVLYKQIIDIAESF